VHGQASRFMSAAAVAAAIVLGTPDGAAAQAAGGNQRPASPAIVAYRKALMNSNSQHMNALRALVTADVNLPDHIRKHAQALADNGKLVSTQSASADYDMFPPESTHATSRATEAIWADKEAFTERVRAFQTATARLNEIAQRGGTKEQITAALTPVQQSCGGCHMAFRGPALPTGQ